MLNQPPASRSAQPRQPRTRLICSGFLLAAMMAATCGCDSAAPVPATQRGAAARRQPAPEQLQRALQFLERLDEFDQQQAIVQASDYFNRWLGSQAPEDDWSPDALTQTLPAAIRQGDIIAGLGEMRLRIEDVRWLLESAWIRDVSQWVSRRPTAGPLTALLNSQLSELDEYEAEQLLIVDRLFDWTVRNIQLDELLPYPAGPATGPGVGAAARRQSGQPAPMRGVPGPGYQVAPWEALLYGHGDALARARVFVLLARQQKIDVVILAFPGQTTPPRPRPWLAAALVGQQLYLFDTRLGLPIPGPDGQWIATLEQVLDDPTLLSRLDVGDEYQYPFKQGDLRDIWALIDVAPQALSQKSSVVESNLTGEDHMVLTVDCSSLAERLKKCRGVSVVFLWTIPFETVWYRDARQELLSEDKAAAADEYLKVGLFQRRTSLARARYLHFREEFETSGERPGAKTLYLQSRVSQTQIDQLEQSPDVQRAFGLERNPNEGQVAWLNRVAVTKIIIATSKLHASYWLGLAHYDTGNYVPAITWLGQRTLEATPDGPWTDGARYNLGRAYEAAGEIEEARKLYLLDDSHQAHGNLLRAKLLRQLMERSGPEETQQDSSDK